MPNTAYILMGCLILGVLLFYALSVVLYSRTFKKCQSNEALVRNGRGGMQLSRSGIFVVPIFHTHSVLSLAPFRVRRLVNSGDVQTDWQFTIAVGEEPDVLRIAATRLLDSDIHERTEFARDAITSAIQSVNSPDFSNPDSEKIAMEAIRASLEKLGLDVLSAGPAAE